MKRSAFVVLSFLALVLTGSAARAANADVSIKTGGNEFHPVIVHVRVGDSVTWTNDDRTLFFQTSHTVTADDGSFNSHTITERGTFVWTFSTAGSFDYHCSIHTGMSGTVVVQARASHTPSPTPTPTKTALPTPKPSKSKSPSPSATATPSSSATPSIDSSSVGTNSTSTGKIISIAIVSVAVLILLGYFVYVRLIRDG